jgi:hypothetical protein
VLERRAVARDSEMLAREFARLIVEQRTGERERVTNAEAKCDVDLASERKLNERRVRDPTRHSAPLHHYPGHMMLREKVVEPLSRRGDRKCCHGNVVMTH